jgi:hypothetical protein
LKYGLVIVYKKYFGLQKNTLGRKLDEYWIIDYSLGIDRRVEKWEDFCFFCPETEEFSPHSNIRRGVAYAVNTAEVFSGGVQIRQFFPCCGKLLCNAACGIRCRPGIGAGIRRQSVPQKEKTTGTDG